MQGPWQLSWVSEDSLLVKPTAGLSALALGSLQTHCQTHFGAHLLDSILAYDSLLLVFALSYAMRADIALELQHGPVNDQSQVPTRLHRLPVCYDPEYALDLADIAVQTGLSAAEIMTLHQSTEYRVLAMGFSPGFGYCGPLPPQLAVPRKQQPRTQVPAGSVAIAETQTAIYPQASPGGWQIVGRCPVVLFDATRPLSQASLLRAGDRVCFYAISRADLMHWEAN